MVAAVTAAGEAVKVKKAAKAEKDEVVAAVTALLNAKAALVAACEKMVAEGAGDKAALEALIEANKPVSRKDKKSKDKAAKKGAAAAPAKGGAAASGGAKEGEAPSKKALKKAAAAEAKAKAKAAYKAGKVPEAAQGEAAAKGGAAQGEAAKKTGGARKSSPGASARGRVGAFPYAAVATAAMTADTLYDGSTCLTVEGTTLYGSHAIARYFARGPNGVAAGLYGDGSALVATEIDQWMDFALAMGPGVSTAGGHLAALNTHLACRTFVVGYATTLADAALWGAVKAAGLEARTAATAGLVHVARWLRLCDTLPHLKHAAGAGAAAAAKAGAGAKTNGSKNTGAAVGTKKGQIVGTLPDLPNAEYGKVVTRFPPEPSG